MKKIFTLCLYVLLTSSIYAQLLTDYNMVGNQVFMTFNDGSSELVDLPTGPPDENYYSGEIAQFTQSIYIDQNGSIQLFFIDGNAYNGQGQWIVDKENLIGDDNSIASNSRIIEAPGNPGLFYIFFEHRGNTSIGFGPQIFFTFVNLVEYNNDVDGNSNDILGNHISFEEFNNSSLPLFNNIYEDYIEIDPENDNYIFYIDSPLLSSTADINHVQLAVTKSDETSLYIKSTSGLTKYQITENNFNDIGFYDLDILSDNPHTHEVFAPLKFEFSCEQNKLFFIDFQTPPATGTNIEFMNIVFVNEENIDQSTIEPIFTLTTDLGEFEDFRENDIAGMDFSSDGRYAYISGSIDFYCIDLETSEFIELNISHPSLINCRSEKLTIDGEDHLVFTSSDEIILLGGLNNPESLSITNLSLPSSNENNVFNFVEFETLDPDSDGFGNFSFSNQEDFYIQPKQTQCCLDSYIIDLESSTSSVCEGGSITYQLSSSSFIEDGEFYWYSEGCGEGWIGTGTSITIDGVTESGTLYVRGEGEHCIGYCLSLPYIVYPNPDISIVTSFVGPHCEGAYIPLFPEGNAVSYEWSNDYVTGTQTIISPNITYTLTGTSSKGCTTTVEFDEKLKDCESACSDLFISEYGHGKFFGHIAQYLEIYNSTPEDIPLAKYEIWKIENEGYWPEQIFSFPEDAIIASGETYTIGDQVLNGFVDYTDEDFCNWTGNEALGLYKKNTNNLIDMVGREGVPDSALGWSIEDVNVATRYRTIIRKQEVQEGNIDWANSADVGGDNSEWLISSFSIANLNLHENTCTNPDKIVINEVDYDQSGVDQEEFIELYNAGNTAVNLNGYLIDLYQEDSDCEKVNPHEVVALEAHIIQPGGYIVICSNSNNNDYCDQNTSLVMNDGNAAIVLRKGNSTMDILSYEGDNGICTEVSGSELEDISTLDYKGLSRIENGIDTDHNNNDFRFTCITPGYENFFTSDKCQEPIQENGRIISNEDSEIENSSYREATVYIDNNHIDFKAFPNPNSGAFELKFVDENIQEYEVEIYNTLGKKIETFERDNNTIQLFEKGIYFVRVSDEKGDSVTKQIFVR